MRRIIFENKVVFVLFLSFIFIIIAVPFKTMAFIPGFTEVRPVDCLNMVYGLLFGVYGALGCAVGNIIADILGGTLEESSWMGFLSNFLVTYIAYKLWYKMTPEEPTLSTIKQVLLYNIDSFVISAIAGIMVAFGVFISYREIDYISIFFNVFFNTLGFSAILGMPVMIICKSIYKIGNSVPKNVRENKYD